VFSSLRECSDEFPHTGKDLFPVSRGEEEPQGPGLGKELLDFGDPRESGGGKEECRLFPEDIEEFPEILGGEFHFTDLVDKKRYLLLQGVLKLREYQALKILNEHRVCSHPQG
jgi:hypothetical protein